MINRFSTSARFTRNPFWRNTRLEKHENDPLDTNPPPTPPQGPRELICGACGCRLARNGEILATGEAYKGFLKHEQTLEGKDREISALASEVARLKEEITTLKASAGEGRSSSSRSVGQRIS